MAEFGAEPAGVKFLLSPAFRLGSIRHILILAVKSTSICEQYNSLDEREL